MSNILKTSSALAAGGVLALLLAQPVFSAGDRAGGGMPMHDMKDMGGMMKGNGTQNGAQAPMSEGVVKKVDKARGKVTIEHGPLENLGMPGMTMAFGVKDAAMLDQLKEGDHISFRAEKVDGKFTVTEIAPAAGGDEHGH